MSLRLAEEMIFSLRTRGRVKCVGFYTTPYIRARVVGVGSSNVGKHNFLCRKESFHVLDHRVRESCLTAIGWLLDGSIFTPHP